MLNAESCALAEVLADWIGPAPAVPAVYLFGDSDVDVQLLGRAKRDGFCKREIALPGRLAIHREQSDEADAAIRRGIVSPV